MVDFKKKLSADDKQAIAKVNALDRLRDLVQQRQAHKVHMDESKLEIDRLNEQIIEAMWDAGVDSDVHNGFKVMLNSGKETEYFDKAEALARGIDADLIAACFKKKQGEPFVEVRTVGKGSRGGGGKGE